MSFSDFKEVAVNDPGTGAFYGSDDLNEIMQIFNAKTVANRKVKIKNPWEFQAHYDILAAQTTPGSPAANTKRFYVEPSNNHFMMKATSGTIIDFDVLAQSPVGEVNTASNIGTAGVGIWLDKVSADLRFKKLNGGSNKITVTNDTGNNEVDIDVAESNLTLNNLNGVLNVNKGGTGLNTLTSQALLKGNGTSAVSLIAAGTDGHILTMVSGAPTWAAASAGTDTKAAVFEAGTQIGSVGRRLNFSNTDDFTITEDAGNDRFNVAITRAEHLVGSWTAVSGITAGPTTPIAGLTKQNIGSTYVDLFLGPGTEGCGCDADGAGRTDFRLYVSWNKNSGSGTHDVRVISQTTADVLASSTNLVTGKNVVTGTIPAFFKNNLRSVKLQARSSVSGDDPIFYGAQLYYK